jgi:uncharacterized protein
MTDRERGGFYASQDADINLDDDGDYFTWTLDEARAVLDPAELEFRQSYWDIGELGDMHHNPAKNVLHVKQTLEELAATAAIWRSCAGRCAIRPAQAAGGARQAAHAVHRPHALYRLERDGGDGLPGDGARAAPGDVQEFALRTLNRLLDEAWDGDADALPRDRLWRRAGQ